MLPTGQLADALPATPRTASAADVSTGPSWTILNAKVKLLSPSEAGPVTPVVASAAVMAVLGVGCLPPRWERWAVRLLNTLPIILPQHLVVGQRVVGLFDKGRWLPQ